MDTAGITLFDLAERRLGWLDRRQEVLSQNIANADTPGWRARDLAPFDLALSRAAPVRTDPHHLAGLLASEADEARSRPREIAPDGNAVAVDAELTKVADTETSQELVTILYRKYMSMFQLAVGKSS